jgi:two-component system, LytTR family, response regulator
MISVSSTRRPERLLLRASDGVVFVDVADVRRVSVAGNYLRVSTGSSEHLVRRTMAELAHALRGAGFIRISRSDLVNGSHIRRIHRRQGGRYEVVLDGGSSLMSSRRYQRDVRAAIAELARVPGVYAMTSSTNAPMAL